MPVLCNKFTLTIQGSSLYTYILILILSIFSIILIYNNYCSKKIKKIKKNKYDFDINNESEINELNENQI